MVLMCWQFPFDSCMCVDHITHNASLPCGVKKCCKIKEGELLHRIKTLGGLLPKIALFSFPSLWSSSTPLYLCRCFSPCTILMKTILKQVIYKSRPTSYTSTIHTFQQTSYSNEKGGQKFGDSDYNGGEKTVVWQCFSS